MSSPASPPWPSRLAAAVGVELPLLQAPLGGGPGTPRLTAAVAEAGGLGMLGVGYLEPDAVAEAVRAVRAETGRPFGANVFLAPPPRQTDVRATRERLAQVARRLGLDAEIPERPPGLPDPEAQVDVLLDLDVPVVSFTFGCPSPALVQRLRSRGVVVLVTVGTVAEARQAVAAGADAVVAQGSEAGGHRGGWSGLEPPGLVALVPAVAGSVEVPVVAAGGVMDGRGAVAARALGADAVALGTAFLRADEAGTDPAYRDALRASDGRTVVTRAFSGRPARGLPNAYLAAWADTGDEPDLPDFPVLNGLTRPLRAASAAAGRADALSLWAGEGVALGRDLPAGELVTAVVAEAHEAMDRLAGARP